MAVMPFPRPDRVRDEFVLPAVIDGYCTGGVVGRDKEGSPVFYDRLALPAIHCRALTIYVHAEHLHELQLFVVNIMRQ